ncbi:MAG: type II toxin-antitoxin system RelE/ParE family toxin [Oscillospiraceae bacterium]|nr:type II toxin-antitoxin system RelE/ParE family toxin [Oscillospiraceae bacterium]
MHEIIFYEDGKGNKPVLDFIRELANSNSKDSRIKLKKVQEYIVVLQTYGATMGAPYMKHLDGDIWELRPISDRILFAGLVDGKFVLLHQFTKKTQKTPKREIEQAKRELEDFRERSGLK